YQVRYQQHTRLLPNLLLDIDLQDISDPEYFNDFSNGLRSTTQTHLFRNAILRYDLSNWHMRALLQDIKTIDRSIAISNRPYERLPQLTLNGDTKITDSGLLFTLDSEFVDFTHEDSTKTTGSRLTLRPGLQLPLSGTAWFFKPAIKFSHTQYDIGTRGNTTIPGTSQTIDNRNLPMTSIDAGLFFERYFENGYQQTLEPRLYYLNVPFVEQGDIPIFDTSTPEFSVAQLFRDNRFIGGDRIGDTNQLTVALTSRILNPDTGIEFLRASIGQIFFFEDRRVSLATTASNTIDNTRQSDIIAELDTRWGHWQSNFDVQWDTTNDKLSKQNYFLHYKSDDKHLFNLGYRKRLKNNTLDLEQTDTSFVYAINNRYSTFFRWNYSLKDKKDINTIAGFSYDSCCWSIQLLAQRRLLNSTSSATSDDYDNSILVQFVFKGLGSISGSGARDTLEQSIYRYSDTLQ
ncbi:MAG TPA: LPS-assembly protein LptD, partial [Gammaproteobacteria bacterium]|nr:LPS-assembly protein LptD [Gammaproteobacteria bacterium]